MKAQLALWTAIAALGLAACDKSDTPGPDDARLGVPSTVAQETVEGVNPADQAFQISNTAPAGGCNMDWTVAAVDTGVE